MQVADVFDRVTGGATGIEFRAYDGSRAGPRDAPVTVEVRSPKAVRYVVQARNDLGLARAYVTGTLEVHGDLHDALSRLWDVSDGNIPYRERWRMLRALGLRTLRPVEPPAEEARPRGRMHSKRRDAQAVSHHYDVSNRFYRWILGPSMAYTCAAYPDADATLEEAQFEKFDLVCRKLDLRPGMRLLDVGCGWGGMVLHAARHYGVEALGVTVAGRQVEWAQAAIADAGLADRAEVRQLDYRDVPESDFDAISSIGLTEHIGRSRMPDYFALLHSKLRPQGRLLNHCITRANNTDPNLPKNGFIDRYVFPDAELSGPGCIISTMHDAGFELRHEENLREHYSRTLAALEPQPRRALGRGGGRRGRAAGARVAPVPGGVRGVVRHELDPAPSGARHEDGGRTRRHAAAARLGDGRAGPRGRRALIIEAAPLRSARSAIAQRRSLRHLAHRPWPVPGGRWLVGQSWRDLLFAHWPVPRDVLRRVVPESLEIDAFEGQCWVGVVPFRMSTVRFAWCPPVLGTSSFPELNLRTYVVSGGRPGVYFLSLDAGNPVAVSIGRRLYGLPYLRARVDMRRQGDAIEFDSSRKEPGWPAAAFTATYRPTAAARPSRPGSLEHWLTERYCFYSVTREHGLRRTEVHHQPWPLQPAAADIRLDALAAAHGIELTGTPLVHFSREQNVVAWAPRPAQRGGA